ncbi:MAG: ribonuclease T2 [Pseudomonadota bacterium]
MRVIVLCLLLIWPAFVRSQQSGEFDYYVLALSWSPNWCAIEGDRRGSEQCDPRHDHGWILHGLWPQFETGYPRDCQTVRKAPSRQMTAEMADIMGTAGLAWHQWRKHGTCSGLTAQQYYELSRYAYGSINRPDVLRRLDKDVRIAPEVIEQSFLQANPELSEHQITITCKSGYIQEARICLTRSLEPRRCGRDVRQDCSADTALFTPVR